MSAPATDRAILLVPGLLGLFLVLGSSVDLIPAIGVFNAKRIIECYLLLAIFLLALAWRPLRAALATQLGLIPRWLAACLSLAFLLGLISAARFPHPAYGLADVALLLALVMAVPLVAACRNATGRAFDRLVILAIAALGLLTVLLEFMGLLAGWSMGIEFSYNQMLVRFAHPRFYNQLQSWTIPVLAALPFVWGAGRRLRMVTILLLGLQWCLLLMSGGRGSALSLVTALVLVAFLVPPERAAWLKLHAGGLILGLVLYAAVLSGHGVFAPAGGDFVEQSVGRAMSHSSGRVHMWSLAWQDAVRNPLLGAGPMRYDCAGPAVQPAHPHSFPLRILAEWGFPAATLLLLSCAVLGWLLIRRLREGGHGNDKRQVLNVMLGAGLLAAALHACLSGVLIMPASQVMAVLLCGWLLGRLSPTGTGPRRSGVPALAWCLAGAVLTSALAAFSTAELGQMELRTRVLKTSGPPAPRYWQYGRACLYSYE